MELLGQEGGSIGVALRSHEAIAAAMRASSLCSIAQKMSVRRSPIPVRSMCALAALQRIRSVLSRRFATF